MTEHEVAAIVHLAGDPTLSATYASVERNNVRGTRNVLEAASRAGVGTVVFASSNHVVGMYETEHAPALYAPMRARPSTTEARSVPTPTTARRRRPARRGAGCTPSGRGSTATPSGSARSGARRSTTRSATPSVRSPRATASAATTTTRRPSPGCAVRGSRGAIAPRSSTRVPRRRNRRRQHVWTEPRHRRWRRIRSVLRGQRQPERVVRPHPRSRAGGLRAGRLRERDDRAAAITRQRRGEVPESLPSRDRRRVTRLRARPQAARPAPRYRRRAGCGRGRPRTRRRECRSHRSRPPRPLSRRCTRSGSPRRRAGVPVRRVDEGGYAKIPP